MHPDVVLVTGDLAEQGHESALEEQAAAALAEIDVPTLVIIGNHDYGHFPKVVHADVPDRGYFNFARWFHGELFVRKPVAGYDFVGFDSGPSIFSLRIMTRGIGEQTLSRVRDAVSEDAAAKRGTILFSHAPTRAALSSDPNELGSNRLGSMAAGAKELEAMMLAASAHGERIIHLAGHTHWSDLFFARAGMSRFERVPFDELTSPVQLDATAILINAPSATRVTFDTVEHGKAYGYVVLRLRPQETVVQFHLFDDHDRSLPRK